MRTIQIKIGDTYICSLENVNMSIINERRGDIESLVLLYMYKYPTDEIRNEIKRKLVDMLVKDIRKEKFKFILNNT